MTLNAMTRSDLLIVLLGFILVTSLYPAFWGKNEPGVSARIYSGEKLVKEVLLAQPEQFQVAGLLGNSTLQIKQGKIRFLDSPCHNHVCIQKGWIHMGQDIAACLPNRVYVQIASAGARFDAINF